MVQESPTHQCCQLLHGISVRLFNCQTPYSPPGTIFHPGPVFSISDLSRICDPPSLHFAALFPNVPSRCVPKPISHTQTLDFQLGDSTQGVEGIKQYTISSKEQVEAESVGSNTLVSKPIIELSLT